MDETFEKLKDALNKISINEFVYWNDCRPTFELFYSYKNELKKEFKDKADMFDELCNTESQQDFLRVLRKYQTEEDRKHIWVHENEDGYLYLV